MNIRKFVSGPFLVEWALFFLALGVGGGLRLYALGDLPHGIYHDEAYYGLDAVNVIDGARPLFFSANNGREPLYIYLLSLSVAVFGRTPFGLRFMAALLGWLTLPATYLLGRVWFNRRVGLLAMWLCAITFWPLALSRVSFRAGALPLFLGLALALGWLGWQHRSAKLAALGGVAYGLAFNTYPAVRITPLAFGIVALFTFLFNRNEPRPSLISQGSVTLMGAFLLAAALVIAPLAGYAATHPAEVFAREGQLSIFETEAGHPLWSLLKHAGLALGMFGWRGDTIARHNLPGRPVFDGWTFVFFLIGLAALAVRSRREPAAALALAWLGVTILPTLLAEDTPHFLRSVALLPVLWLIPAVGFEAFIQTQAGPLKIPASLKAGAVAGMLALSTGLTVYDYFFRYVQSPITDYYFESAATELAAEINGHPGFSNHIDDRLWDNFASLRFLIANRAGAGSPGRVLLAVWPYEPEAVRAAVAALPPNSQINATRGGLARGDLEGTPYSLYTLYRAEPANLANEPLAARFGEAVELRGTKVVESNNTVQIRLGWAVANPVRVDYHVFVHVLAGGEIAAQSDGEPVGGLYHFSWLKPGDVLEDRYTLPRGEQVRVGVYAPDGTLLGEPVMLK